MAPRRSIMDGIGGRVREARLRKGMSQEELALAVGYKGRFSISRIETGDSKPSAEYVTKLAEALDVTADWLLGVDKPMSILEEAFTKRPVMRTLFSLAEGWTDDQVETAIKIAEMLAGTNNSTED